MPPMREIMAACGDSRVSTVVIMAAAQVSKTECLLNTLGWHIDNDPAPILIVLPTLELCETWSRERLAPMLRDTPALRDKLADVKSRDADNSVRTKAFGGGRLSITGANSPSGLASRPIRILLGDEVDKWPLSAGTEGSPLALAVQRQATFWNRKTIIASTPGRKSQSVIFAEWSKTDMRRFWVPCPDCDTPQVLKFGRLVWEKHQTAPPRAKFGKHRPETAYYCCEHCGCLWDDSARWGAILAADQRNQAGDGTCGWRAERDSDGHVGFHVPALLSSWRTHAEIAAEFVLARNDDFKLQVFVNSVLGEPWEERAEGPGTDAEALAARAEPYTPSDLPRGVRCLTAGADVQKDRIEVQIIGWGEGDEAWTVAYYVIHGGTAAPDAWADLDAVLFKKYRTEDARELVIRAACVDAGYQSAAVFNFCKKRQLSRRIYAVRGLASHVSRRPIWTGTPSRAGPQGREQVFPIGVDTAKEAVYAALKNGRPGPGYVHFPSIVDFGPEYFAQLTAEEVQLTKGRGGSIRREWILPLGKRNEALDTFVYALAARKSLRIDFKAAPPPHIEPAVSTNVPPPKRRLSDFANLGT